MVASASSDAAPRRIVEDDAAPFDDILTFSPTDIATTSMSDLYRRSCAHVRVQPSEVILRQLPRTFVDEKPVYLQVSSLDASGTYLGNRGVAALIPVIDACTRMTHLLLPRVGLKADVAKALIAHLETHPGITSVDLSHNDLGTAVGLLLLRLVTRHRRVFSLRYDESLVIPPLRKKIDRQLAHNETIRGQFHVPLIPLTADERDAQVARALQEAEERARAARAEVQRRLQEDRLPPWAVPLLAELRIILLKHRRHMNNVTSVFDTSSVASFAVGKKSTPGLMASASSPPTTRLLDLECRLNSFVRGMKILGVKSVTMDLTLTTSSASSSQSVIEKHVIKGVSSAAGAANDVTAARYREVAQWFEAHRVVDVSGQRSVSTANPVGATTTTDADRVDSPPPPSAATEVVELVHVGKILHALRSHAVLRKSPAAGGGLWIPTQSSIIHALDKIYDVREMVLRELEAADVDMTFSVSAHELANTLSAVTRNPQAVVRILQEYLGESFDAVVLDDQDAAYPLQQRYLIAAAKPNAGPSEADVKYHGFLDSLVLDVDETYEPEIEEELRRAREQFTGRSAIAHAADCPVITAARRLSACAPSTVS